MYRPDRESIRPSYENHLGLLICTGTLLSDKAKTVLEDSAGINVNGVWILASARMDVALFGFDYLNIV
jgi:hypothetical protein